MNFFYVAIVLCLINYCISHRYTTVDALTPGNIQIHTFYDLLTLMHRYSI